MIRFEKLYEDAKEPIRSTTNSAGYDLFANESMIIPSHENRLIKTGIIIHLPNDMFFGITSRSGLALKNRVFVNNTFGIVDADYKKEIGIILYNGGTEDFIVNKYDKIAQGIIQKYFVTDDDNAEGERTGGFGSTGV